VRALAIASVTAVFLTLACQLGPASDRGEVSGLVGGWPAAPLGGDVAPEPGKTVQFVPAAGGATATTVSGSDGRYSIYLSPGVYEVRLAGFAAVGLLYGRNPKTYGQWPRVTVVAGRQSKVDLIYDTGIR